MANRVFLGLGSNKGDRLGFLKHATQLMDTDEKCCVIKCSSVYESTPLGKKDQDNYYNAVVIISTEYELEEFFIFTKQLELEVGRSDYEHWGPREIDIDILLFDDLVFADHNISIPHIELTERDFVMEPLLEIAPDTIHPAFGMQLKEMMINIASKHIIKKIDVDLLNSPEGNLG